MTTNKTLITSDRAAEYLSISARTLSKWRSTGENNIPFFKIGRCVRYRHSDLDSYLLKHFHTREDD